MDSTDIPDTYLFALSIRGLARRVHPVGWDAPLPAPTKPLFSAYFAFLCELALRTSALRALCVARKCFSL